MEIKSKYTKDNYNEFIEYLKDQSEDSYKEFNYKLIPNENMALGIRVPKLRSIGKEIYKGDYKSFISCFDGKYFEEVMVLGFIIGNIKNLEESIEETKKFIPKIRNWAICDSFSSSLRLAKKYPKEYIDLIEYSISLNTEYSIRFGAVMLMDYYINDEYIDYVLKMYKAIKSEDYYVNMAVAWGISVCYVKFPEKTLSILTEKSLDKFIHNKSIQKICESLRVSKEDKAYLKTLKI